MCNYFIVRFTQGSELMEKHLSISCSTDILDSSDFAPLLNIKDEPLSEGGKHLQMFKGILITVNVNIDWFFQEASIFLII